MTDITSYISEGIKAVKKLLREDDFFNANLGCQELLKVAPYDRKLLKLMTKIEKKILGQNLKIVKKEIKKTWRLWDEKRYSELLQIYQRLYEYAPQYEKLHDLMEKAEEALGQEEKENRRLFIKQTFEAIEKMYREDRWGEVIQACKELLVIDPRNSDVKNLLAKAREKLVEWRLQNEERLVDSAEFERQIAFFNELLGVDPHAEKVKKMLIEARGKLQEKQNIEAKILSNEGEKRIKELFDNQEYEKVLQSCEELKIVDLKNFIANLYEKKARAAMDDEIEQKVFKLIVEGFSKLREEYQRNKVGFMKI